MKLEFNQESDVTDNKLKKFEEVLDNKTAVVLHHSEYCGHCLAMRDEFDKFKEDTKHHVVEVEGGALSKLSKSKKVYSKVGPKDGQMYFPMILVFIRRTTMTTPLKLEYEGKRDAASIKEFIDTKVKEQKAKASKTKSLKKK